MTIPRVRATTACEMSLSMRLTHVLAASCLGFLLSGCAREVPPAMTPSASLLAPPAGQAAVVFVRPLSPCDTSEYSIVVDDHGRFVGNVAPGTQIVVPITPGTHVFYSWSNIDSRSEREPSFNPVMATRVDARGEGPQYVALIVQMQDSTVTRCNAYSHVSMHRVRPGQRDDTLWSDLQEWLRSTQPLVANQPAGQATLNANPALLQTHLELGHAKLRAMDDFHARKARRDAERAGAK